MDSLELVSFQSPIFNTVQGEGSLIGTPSTFIRLQGCNQDCGWCETKDSWVPGLGTVLSVPDVVRKLQEVGCLDHVVVTGGNPMLQSEALVKLLSSAFFRDKHITVETNAYSYRAPLQSGGRHVNLLFPHHAGLLWSLSPKLHQNCVSTVREYLSRKRREFNTREAAQVKLVVGTIEDITHAGELFVALRGADDWGVRVPTSYILQPEFSKMRSLTKNPGFMDALRKLPVTVKVIPQAHKSMSLM